MTTTEIKHPFNKLDSPWIVEMIEDFNDRKLYSLAEEWTEILEAIQEDCIE
jgi:hypothetical protein